MNTFQYFTNLLYNKLVIQSINRGSDMKFWERVIINEHTLTDLEDSLVEYIENNKDEVSNQTITILAKHFFTVPNTISRLCHKLGYEGFVDLKSHLKQELELSNTLQTNALADYIYETINLIEKERLKKCVSLFQTSKAVTFFAVGQTGELTKIAVNNFYAFDTKFNFLEYPNTVSRKIELAKKEIFFFVSLSGETKEIIKLAEQAKFNNQIVISLTELSKNTLSKISDISLYCCIKNEKVNGYNVTDKTPLMIVLNQLFHTYLAMQNLI